ncbi:MAG TPA: NFACT RNA binding domain-containing protein [Candidatus Cybelea sp.]|jgi:predicted ribosome quality control (RQC) complex YloA/Tae2 family protein
MLTDWVLIGRLGRELDERLRGAKVQDVGLLDDGRVAMLFRSRGERRVLAIDLFSSPPLVTLEDQELAILEEPGFIRALARALSGMTLQGVMSRRFDRLLRLRFAARSRFGVGEQLDLYVELVPRFGNIVLVKGEIVVAARKEFALSENARRAVQVGTPYALPPLPASPRTLAPETDGQLTDADAPPLYVYRRSGAIAQAYVVPIEGLEGAQLSRASSLLDLFAEVRDQQRTRAESESSGRRRQALLKRLQARDDRLRRELERIASKRAAARGREGLRCEGEGIFATLYSLPESERETAKERAAVLFAEYRKLGNSLPHLEERERAVNESRAAIETLRWEAERTAEEDFPDVVAAADALLRRRETTPQPPSHKRKRRTLELRTAAGSRIAIGRSPLENAELTFRLARPNDLWFHAKGVPGAHVILSRDDRGRVPDEDLEAAASLAAYYSKARDAGAAPVDYTLRKHVRKQRAAAPGLVWYTNAKTIVARPQPLDSLKDTPG